VILADTSAWVEWLRRTHSATDERMDALIADTDELALTDAVMMELLAGGGDRAQLRRLRRFLARFRFLPTHGPSDWEDAASLFRACRRAGHTPRSQLDCLIAAVAIRNEAPLLHADSDFDSIARHTALKLA
jgi:predicted nucleic acid-binding protein